MKKLTFFFLLALVAFALVAFGSGESLIPTKSVEAGLLSCPDDEWKYPTRISEGTVEISGQRPRRTPEKLSKFGERDFSK